MVHSLTGIYLPVANGLLSLFLALTWKVIRTGTPLPMVFTFIIRLLLGVYQQPGGGGGPQGIAQLATAFHVKSAIGEEVKAHMKLGY